MNICLFIYIYIYVFYGYSIWATWYLRTLVEKFHSPRKILEKLTVSVNMLPSRVDTQQEAENASCFLLAWLRLLLYRGKLVTLFKHYFLPVVSTVASQREGCKFDSQALVLSVWRLHVLRACVWGLAIN